MAAVFDPKIAEQFTQDRSMPKHKHMREEFHPLTGKNDLVNMEGQVWKMWRAVFNPGFSARNILSLVPAMTEEALEFKKSLEKLAKSGKVVPFEDGIIKATVDIIGRVVLGARLRAQTTDAPLFTALTKQVGQLLRDRAPPSLFKALNPFRPFLVRYNNYVIRREALPHIERQMREHLSSERINGSKTVISLAITSYLNEASAAGLGPSAKLDSDFLDTAISQLKVFLLAGHDTTASTLSFAYYLLDRYPSVLQKVLAEHDEVLGRDTGLAVSNIIDNPTLLNQLSYTNAVLKETLRLYPPIGTVREGAPDLFLTQPATGERFPTDGFMLFISSPAMHRWEALWPEPDKMIPERWLVKEGDPLYPLKSAFRPFELGPRNCIGQELAMMEMRLILALTIREYAVSPQYAEDAPLFFGEKGYQWMTPAQITSHPKDGMPAKVLRRERRVS
ncbi:putative sterigmatocystin biosynthesis P450 monooxygenase stcS-like protein 5 [Colletotrichum chlorophyti]|uniref:Putative sterigmatocystin biosynthesis P450 monooxygenase stcS-like protein 5 n=1 Tax=Colletotrichum chlorophyti TaxID=708187 RepID=A0A1Q8RTC4_9PEZI|nr:putative sterigmatocystin biosynthesis P450 monooxygenase stcS-like protein 5 [Colletotrichum chlorophyti]